LVVRHSTANISILNSASVIAVRTRTSTNAHNWQELLVGSLELISVQV